MTEGNGPDELNRLSQELIREAGVLMGNDANHMIVVLANVFANAVRQINAFADAPHDGEPSA